MIHLDVHKDSIKKYNKTRAVNHASLFCYAPFNSMNFQQNGDVLVCCYNRDYVIGKFPEQSLKEIWFGEKANALRRLFYNNLLDDGCNGCINQLTSSNFEGLHAKNYDEYASNFNPEKVAYPTVMEFEISNLCNLECTMCTGYFSSSIRKNREKLPPIPYMYENNFVDQLLEFIPHLTNAKFLGGEPFLIKEYIVLWEKISERNSAINISITTNGTILNERIKKVLEKLNVWIVMSIDSIVESTYTKIRINSNFKRVMENLAYFKAYTEKKNTGLSLAVCPITDNWKEMADLVNFCNKNGFAIYFNTVTRPMDKSLKYLHPQELISLTRELKKQFYSKGLCFSYASKNVKQFKSFINQVEKWLSDFNIKDLNAFYNQNLKFEKDISEFQKTINISSEYNKSCHDEILVLLPQAHYISNINEEKTARINFYIKDFRRRLEEIRLKYGNKDFCCSFLYASNSLVKATKIYKPIDYCEVEKIVSRIHNAIKEESYWEYLAKGFILSDPLDAVKSIPNFNVLNDLEFEEKFLKELKKNRNNNF